jgi:hypothetical protein
MILLHAMFIIALENCPFLTESNVTMLQHKAAIKIVAYLALLAVALTPSVAAANFQICTPTVVFAPEVTIQTPPQNRHGCSAGAAIRLPDGSSVWRCTTGSTVPLASKNLVILVRADGSSKKLPDSTPSEGIFQFSVWLIDLDNDGQEERILSYWNGRGETGQINSWTSIVFRADWANLTPEGEEGERNMSGATDIHDWSLNSLIKNPVDPSKCLLALSEFKSRDNVHGMQVDFYELGRASLIPPVSQATYFRPSNSRFKADIRKTYRTSRYSGNIARWLSSTDTKQFQTP